MAWTRNDASDPKSWTTRGESRGLVISSSLVPGLL